MLDLEIYDENRFREWWKQLDLESEWLDLESDENG